MQYDREKLTFLRETNARQIRKTVERIISQITLKQRGPVFQAVVEESLSLSRLDHSVFIAKLQLLGTYYPDSAESTILLTLNSSSVGTVAKNKVTLHKVASDLYAENRIDVTKEHRRLGIGTALFDGAEEIAIKVADFIADHCTIHRLIIIRKDGTQPQEESFGWTTRQTKEKKEFQITGRNEFRRTIPIKNH